MFKHILIPTDGSGQSTRAVKAGVALAKALGASVTGVFAEPAPTPVDACAPPCWDRRAPGTFFWTGHDPTGNLTRWLRRFSLPIH